MRRRSNNRNLPATKAGIALAGFLLVLAGAGHQALAATVPGVLSAQGVIRDPATGTPVADGNYDLHFKIYAVQTGGAALHTEDKLMTPLKRGVFGVLIGPVPTAVVTGNSELWVGVAVNADVELPRQRLVAAPFAIQAEHANNADSAANLTCTGCVSGTQLGSGAVTAAKIGAGAVGTTELANLGVTAAKIGAGAVGATQLAADAITDAHVANDILTAASLASDSVTAAEIAAGAVGTSEIADGTVGLADLAGSSVDSNKIADGSVATIDLAAGAVTSAKIAACAGEQILKYVAGVGWTCVAVNAHNHMNQDWPSGAATTDGLVVQVATAGNAGLSGVHTAGAGVGYGTWGRSVSATGFGAFGTNATGYGVGGDTTSGRGVFGTATGTGALTNYGVYGSSAGDTGRGVYGTATATTAGAMHAGVLGRSTTGDRRVGVLGTTLSTELSGASMARGAAIVANSGSSADDLFAGYYFGTQYARIRYDGAIMGTGTVSIGAPAFRTYGNVGASCFNAAYISASYTYLYYTGLPSSLVCYSWGSLTLPDDVKIGSVYCTVYDNTASYNIQAQLFRVKLSSTDSIPDQSILFDTATTDAQVSTAWLSIGDTSVDAACLESATYPCNIVNNAVFSYAIRVRFSDAYGAGSNLRFMGCRVNYSPS